MSRACKCAHFERSTCYWQGYKGNKGDKGEKGGKGSEVITACTESLLFTVGKEGLYSL